MATKQGIMAEWLQIVIAAVIASIPAIYAVYRTRNKTDADATETIGKAYKALFDEYDDKIKALQTEIDEIKAERTARELELNNRILELETENRGLRKELGTAQGEIRRMKLEIQRLKKSTGELKGE